MNKKAYFVHIPKTAGNTVRTVLKRLDLLTNPGEEKHQREHHFGSRKATRALLSHPSFNAEYWPSYLDDPCFHAADLSFTIIRNPYDLLVSYYSHYNVVEAKNWTDRGWAHVNGYHQLTHFDEFVRLYCSCDPEDWHVPSLNRNLFGQIFDDNNKLSVDYAIRLENLHEGLTILTDMLTEDDSDCRIESILPIDNPSRHRHVGPYQNLYTSELQELVEKKCSAELSIFNYTFLEENINRNSPIIDLKTLDL